MLLLPVGLERLQNINICVVGCINGCYIVSDGPLIIWASINLWMADNWFCIDFNEFRV